MFQIKMEQRANIKFCFKLENVFMLLKQRKAINVKSCTLVFEWFGRFCNGQDGECG